MRIYTLLGDAAYARTAEFRTSPSATPRCWPAIGRADWAGAREALDRCRGRDARLEDLYDLYEERMAYLAANAPAADWNGIFIAATE